MVWPSWRRCCRNAEKSGPPACAPMVWMSCSPFDLVGEAEGEKQARQGDQAAVWCAERRSDTEASHASEEGEDIAFQIHPRPGAELG